MAAARCNLLNSELKAEDLLIKFKLNLKCSGMDGSCLYSCIPVKLALRYLLNLFGFRLFRQDFQEKNIKSRLQFKEHS
jgi:hypothetical protein